MFGFLKDKLKKAVSIFSKKVEEEAKEEIKEEIVKALSQPPKSSKAEKKEEPRKEKLPEKPKKERPIKPARLPKKGLAGPKAQKAEGIELIEKAEKAREIREGPLPEILKEPQKPVVAEKPIAEEKSQEQKSFFGKIKEKFVKKEAIEKPEAGQPKEEAIEEEEKGFFGLIRQKIVTKKIDEKQFDEMFWDLELAMLENNVALEVIDKIKNDLKKKLVNVPIKKSKVEGTIMDSLKSSIESLFDVQKIDLIKMVKEKKGSPFVIVFVGVNGAGKTTTIAKVGRLLLDNKISCVLVAADTWRAASIEQLEYHADKLGVKIVKHKYGSDPAAVAFDGIAMAKARGIDVVLIDTAGRQHSNVNLVAEMEKIVRVTKPDLKLFIGESITGNDCVDQMKSFNAAIDIDGVILSKADVDEKGGAAISMSYVSGKPILYLGTGQEYSDLEPFDKNKIISSLGL